MSPRKASSAAGTETESRAPDPRFLRLCDALASDRRYASAVAEYRGRQRSGAPRKFGSNGLRTGGKIFAMMAQGSLVVKLPAPRVQALVADGVGTPFDPGHGRVMKEWLVVTSPKARWRDLAAEAFDFVGGGSGR